ncbi:M20 family metallo-hydrolase [Lentibacillus saliphilus]|uniref:M20 family metallo-hydrolase n=1 Tax=Lentibacillus saliphilus TaxID=2737028 RepID=UPI001C2F0F72|nr:M20 family metallo-hydrolase [Lentibacillus saliphilus]
MVQQWLEEHMLKLNLVDTMKQPNGFTRLGYTIEETAAIDQFKNIAENDLGLTVLEDVAGNVIARWEGTDLDQPAVATGSHLDTVINGGGYDGLAGVLCALGAIRVLKDEGFQPTHPIEIIVFRSEESARFGISTLGSKAISGLFDPTIGNTLDSDGISIEAAVSACGYDWNDFSKAERPQASLKSFVELHIEQGMQIEEAGKDIGVVEGIATPIRLTIVVNGQASHTGTTPMDKRKDALVAVAPVINFVHEYTKNLNNVESTPIVATVSTMHLEPNAMNVIPARVELGVDIRSVSDALKENVAEAIRNKCHELALTYHVEIGVTELVNNPSVHLDQSLVKKIYGMGETIGLKPHLMNSGAGHDVMNMAAKWPSGLIFIPCKDGLSHHPDEHASLADLEKGVAILSAYLKTEAGGIQ